MNKIILMVVMLGMSGGVYAADFNDLAVKANDIKAMPAAISAPEAASSMPSDFQAPVKYKGDIMFSDEGYGSGLIIITGDAAKGFWKVMTAAKHFPASQDYSVIKPAQGQMAKVERKESASGMVCYTFPAHNAAGTEWETDAQGNLVSTYSCTFSIADTTTMTFNK